MPAKDCVALLVFGGMRRKTTPGPKEMSSVRTRAASEVGDRASEEDATVTKRTKSHS